MNTFNLNFPATETTVVRVCSFERCERERTVRHNDERHQHPTSWKLRVFSRTCPGMWWHISFPRVELIIVMQMTDSGDYGKLCGSIGLEASSSRRVHARCVGESRGQLTESDKLNYE
jgi:hypothetical protein